MNIERAICVVVLLICESLEAAELQTVQIKSSSDGKLQSARLFVPDDARKSPAPLLVVLHTWSGNYKQKGFVEECLVECERRGWSLVHPDFRGPNLRPQACASDLAVQDVLDSVDYMKRGAKVDERRIYVVGASGGGHMTLVMATRAPQLWAGASAWVPISDLAAWHGEATNRKLKYAGELEKICGGPPGKSDAVDEQYRRRSPLFHFDAAKGVSIDINAGINDGHTGSVLVSHSLLAFNRLADVNGKPQQKLSADEIGTMTNERVIPKSLLGNVRVQEKRKHSVLFRRVAGPVRVTIFNGGHEGDMPTAIGWLATQSK